MPRDRRLVLACARLPGVGRRRLYTLLERSATLGIATGDDFATFLRVKAADLRVAWTPGDINLAWEAGGEMSDACRRRDWRLWAVGRDGYPGDLLRLEDPPAALFVHGDPGDMTTPRVAIVGTRASCHPMPVFKIVAPAALMARASSSTSGQELPSGMRSIRLMR